MFFMGTYTPKLDDKGRLFLPAKFRDQLAEGLVVTRGQERCLTVWPMADFVELTRRAQEAPVTVKGARDYTRFLFAGASEETPDKQGRISITPMLREYAALAARRGGHRRDEPDRDLGPGRAGSSTPRSRRRSSPSSARRSSPGSDPARTTDQPAPPPTAPSTTAQRIRRARSRARSLRHLGHLPRFQTAAIWGTFPGSRRPLPTGERAGTWSCGFPQHQSPPSTTHAGTTTALRAGSRP